MSKIADIAKEKRELEKSLKSTPEQPTTPPDSSNKPTSIEKRLRKLPWKLRDT